LASPERIVQIRQNRLLTLNAEIETPYVDRMSVADEVATSRRLFAAHNWPTIDVTRRSIEETAAAIIDLHRAHSMQFITQA
jgi:regulator of PEP synthase PpsR (kinase-PPPase family)